MPNFFTDKNQNQLYIPKSEIEIRENYYANHSELECLDIECPSSLRIIRHNAFSNCTALTTIVFPSSLTAIGFGAFHGCTSLKYIEFPPLLTSIGNGVFRKCSSLIDINLRSSNVRSIGDYAFAGCTSLKVVEFPPCIARIGFCSFSECTSLISAVIPDSTNYQIINTTETRESSNSSGIHFVPLSTQTILQIEQAAFSQCSSLLNVAIPLSLSIHEDDWFEDCSVLMHKKSSTHLLNDLVISSWLQKRYSFDNLPYHSICYFHIHSATSLIIAQLLRNNNHQNHSTSKCLLAVDFLGMTALHVLVCNTQVTALQIETFTKIQPALKYAQNILGQSPFELFLICRSIEHKTANKFSLIDALELGMSWETIHCLLHLGMSMSCCISTLDRWHLDKNPLFLSAILKQCHLEVVYNLALHNVDILLSPLSRRGNGSGKKRYRK